MKLYQGIAIAKNDINTIIKKDEKGIITAYLPNENIFAICFGNGRWYTFQDPKQWIFNNFEIILE